MNTTSKPARRTSMSSLLQEKILREPPVYMITSIGRHLQHRRPRACMLRGLADSEVQQQPFANCIPVLQHARRRVHGNAERAAGPGSGLYPQQHLRLDACGATLERLPTHASREPTVH